MGGPIDWLNEEEEEAAGPEPLYADDPETPEDASSHRRLGGVYGAALSREQTTEQVKPLTVEEARALLLKSHGIAISETDPLLMIVTLFGRVLQDYQHLLNKHDQEMATAISTSAKATAKAVDDSLETLKDKTVRAGITGTLALVERQAVAVEGTLAAMRQVRRSIAALSVINWLATAVCITLLWATLK